MPGGCRRLHWVVKEVADATAQEARLREWVSVKILQEQSSRGSGLGRPLRVTVATAVFVLDLGSGR